jgi:hypothetical protein
MAYQYRLVRGGAVAIFVSISGDLLAAGRERGYSR